MPYLYQRIPIRTLDAMADPAGAGPASRFPLDMTALLTDLEFENLVNEVFFRTNVGFATLDRANTVAEEIMSVIDSELAR
jgi:hypothetical protein